MPRVMSVDAMVQGPNFELRQKQKELYYNKEKLLENGDRWEVLAKNIKLDKPYR